MLPSALILSVAGGGSMALGGNAATEEGGSPIPLYCNNGSVKCNSTALYCNATTYTP